MWIYKKEKNQFLKNILPKYLPVLMHIIRISLGCVFVFSGFVKAIDPLGSTYKFDDYFHAFGGFFNGLTPIAFPAAIILSTLELLIGLNLLSGVKIRLSSWLAFIFMLVMTPLTLYVALKNPVTDCGCFGDALVISNWATFYKNIVLIALIILLLKFSQNIRLVFMPRIERILLVIFILIGISLSAYSYRHLPLIDFRPYKIGVNIPASMKMPDNAPTDKYVTTFIYQKDGLQKEFTLENYPKGDSTWKFVDQKTVLISQGFKPPIHDFSITNAQYEDITQHVVHYTGSTYLLVMYDLAKTSEEGAKKAEEVYKNALKSGIKFYALTASGDFAVQEFVKKTGVTYPFCKTDPITLKTVIRANPGLVLIKNGTITGKWNWRDF